ncbi:MAG: serine hydrolase domain-containing protein [Solirubrobacterales bacterium]
MSTTEMNLSTVSAQNGRRFCDTRLTRLIERVERDVASARIHGAVIGVIADGEIVLNHALGTQEGVTPTRLDSIFRIYSMTKMFTSVAAMQLYERGEILLSDPIELYMPQFGNPMVVEHGKTRPARRSISVQDLLCHTSGLAGGVNPSPGMAEMYAAAGIERFHHDRAATLYTSEEFVELIAALPLAHDPGSTWEYGFSTDILGRLIEVVSGTSLDRYCVENIFEPLEMVDTAWHVDAESLERLCEPTGQHDFVDPTDPPRFVSGGSGAYSTAVDYLKFAEFLRTGAEPTAGSLISPKSLQLMLSDHLGDRANTGPDYIPGMGYGFGLGAAVRTDRGGAPFPGTRGDFWWVGSAGTSFIVDRREHLSAVLLTQHFGSAKHYHFVLRAMLYQALTGSADADIPERWPEFESEISA